MTADWIPGAVVATAGWIYSLWRASIVSAKAATALEAKIGVIEERFDVRTRNDEKAAESWAADTKAAMKDLHSVATDVRVFTAEQAIINRVNTMALTSITDKLESHDKSLTDHSSSLIFLRQIMQGVCTPAKPCWTETKEK